MIRPPPSSSSSSISGSPPRAFIVAASPGCSHLIFVMWRQMAIASSGAAVVAAGHSHAPTLSRHGDSQIRSVVVVRWICSSPPRPRGDWPPLVAGRELHPARRQEPPVGLHSLMGPCPSWLLDGWSRAAPPCCRWGRSRPCRRLLPSQAEAAWPLGGCAAASVTAAAMPCSALFSLSVRDAVQAEEIR